MTRQRSYRNSNRPVTRPYSTLSRTSAAAARLYAGVRAARAVYNSQAGQFARRVGSSAGNTIRNYIRGPSRYQSGSTNTTMSRPRSDMVRMSAQSSRLGGFVRARSGNLRRSVNYNYAKQGITYSTETQALITASHCAYIGHTTTNYQQWAKYFCFSLLKEICSKQGIDINNFADGPVGFAVGDVFTLAYQTTPVAAFTTRTYTVVLGDLASYDTVATAIWVQVFFPIIADITLFSNRAIMRDFAWTPVGERLIKISLIDGRILLTSKASLKMQNRSVTVVADNEADDVNNAPVHGKVYEGTGSAMYARDISSFQPPDRIQGVVSFSSPETSMDEPPPPYFFVGCKKSGKVRMNPGTIKTSVLQYKGNIPINVFWRMMSATYATATDDFHSVPFGKFRYFALERIIGNIGAEAETIQIAFEHEVTLNMKLQVKHSKYTAPMIDNSS